MKRTKRIVGLCVCMVLLVSLMVLPASAAQVSGPWVDRIGTFRMTGQNNYIREYACAAQSILWGYSPTSDIIANSGKVDGMFGSETARAVRIFQEDHGLGADGIVGPATWKAMAGSMTMNGNNEFISGSRRAIGANYQNSLWRFYYFTTNGYPSATFHDCSF